MLDTITLVLNSLLTQAPILEVLFAGRRRRQFFRELSSQCERIVHLRSPQARGTRGAAERIHRYVDAFLAAKSHLLTDPTAAAQALETGVLFHSQVKFVRLGV